MNRSAMVILVTTVVVGCGSKDDSTPNAVRAMVEAAGSAPRVEAAMEQAERFRQDRIARGDTVAMPYADLKAFLPGEIEGYTAEGGPSGSQQAMPGFSMSQTQQTWVRSGDAGGGPTPEIEITLVDFGGTQQGYAMLAAPVLMGFSQEDDHRRVGSVSIEVPHTGAWEEFDKDSKDAKITAVARYRYVITVEARNHGDDQSAMVKRLAAEVARKFEGR